MSRRRTDRRRTDRRATDHRTAAVAAWLALSILGAHGPQLDRRAVAEDPVGAAARPRTDAPTTVKEARGRARLLHEAIHGALQVTHRDFFREDEGLAIPSRSLEDVFKELTRSCDVELRWLSVNADAMNVDNKPRTAFEKSAAKALAAGQLEFESTEDGVYRHAGAIRLASQCLKCHLPRRTTDGDRAAGLVIAMRLENPE